MNRNLLIKDVWFALGTAYLDLGFPIILLFCSNSHFSHAVKAVHMLLKLRRHVNGFYYAVFTQKRGDTHGIRGHPVPKICF